MNALIVLAAAGFFVSYSCVAQLGNTTGNKDKVTDVRTVPWPEVPQAVQRTLRSQAGTDSLVGVQQTTLNGQSVYIGAFQRDGKIVEVPLLADGSIYTDQTTLAWNQVPTAVQNALQAQTDMARVMSISQQNTGGRIVYVFTIRNAAQLSQLQFAPDGSFLGPIGQPPTPVSATAVAWDQLPETVQRSATAQAGTARIAAISRAMMNNEPVYEFTATETGGGQTSFRVAESGVVVGQSTITEAAGAQPARRGGLPIVELPDAVQSTVKNITGATQVDSVQPQFVNGRLCYEVTFRRDGRPTSVCVSEDGGVIR